SAFVERRPAPRERERRRLPPQSRLQMDHLRRVQGRPGARRRKGRRNMSELTAALDELNGALSLASHELKSPLTTILTCLQLVESKVERLAPLFPDAPDVAKTLAKTHELLALASRQVEFADRIATDLVDASRVQAAQFTLAPRMCDLGQVIEEAAAAQHVAH